MKSITIITVTLFGLSSVAYVHGQASPKPAAGEKSAAVAGSGKRSDVYHVHFTKAALGKAVQLGDWLKTPNPNAPMPEHFIVLRHRMATPGITLLLRIWAQKRPWKLRVRPFLRISGI